ncbi:MAG: tail fiber protein [Candidatus Marinimicrobia bacterium]|nr:tail fiber protein [Candidatus Neomarinimicrobiota bacterium]
MKGDFSRNTFKPEKHYSSVSMQQGRVQLDADWNEQNDIQSYLSQRSSTDIIGLTGIPRDNEGFLITADGDDLTISPGHIFVDGILCECETKTNGGSNHSLLTQPDYYEKDIGKLTDGEGFYVVYLDVWQRHISVIEDSDIREVALGGPDTATRTKTIWQVKLVRMSAEQDPNDFETASENWIDHIERSDAKMYASISDTESKGGYRSLENQLYRVEIHDGGKPGTATFKWSRDNGSIVAGWNAQYKDDRNLGIDRQGSDETRWFKSGQWVELIDDQRELAGEPGTLVRITQSGKDSITIDKATATGTYDLSEFKFNPKIIRWDFMGDEVMRVDTKNRVELEDGVKIKFEGTKFRTGDYWLIPARTSTAGVEWPADKKGEPTALPPKGIGHHYCRLAMVNYSPSGFDSEVVDSRRKFPSLTRLKGFGSHTDAPYDSVYIDEGGNVGIGTLEPESKLDVHGSAIVGGDLTAKGNTTIGLLDSNSNLTVNGTFDVTETLTVGGDVNIGTSESKANLDVHGSANVDENLTVLGNFSVQGEMTILDLKKKAGNIQLGDEDGDTITIHGTLRSNHTSKSLEVGDDKKKTGLHVTGTLIVDENVGIGTAPETGKKLDVNGDVQVRNGLWVHEELEVDGDVGIGTAPDEGIKLDINGDVRTNGSLLIGNLNVSEWIRLLDSDANNQLELHTNLENDIRKDLIGQSGAPSNNAGFKISVNEDGRLNIGIGHYYVNGILCKNDSELNYEEQDFLRGGNGIAQLEPGNNIVYLDVRQKHVTALEDSELRQLTLGGPDITTRIQTNWQVRLIKSELTDCYSIPNNWVPEEAVGTGMLNARVKPGYEIKDPSGDGRLKNQLYRIEVHEGGNSGSGGDNPTFKWSRHNGSIVAGIEDWDIGTDPVKTVTVSSSNDLALKSFSTGDMAEITDDTHGLRGDHGIIVEVQEVDGYDIKFIIVNADDRDFDPSNEFPNNPKIRLWDSEEELKITQPGSNKGWLDIEDGVQIKFEKKGEYKSGDYWLIPARTSDGIVLWPEGAGFLPPHGIKHYYSPIATVQVKEGAEPKFNSDEISDCRKIFGSQTEQTGLFYVSGDGQESMPGGKLPEPLRVGVSNGWQPFRGAKVRFSKKSGEEWEALSDVISDSEGIAEFEWILDGDVENHRIMAELIDADENRIHMPIIFTAMFSKAEGITRRIHQPAHELSVGNAIYYNAAEKKYKLAQSDLETTTGLFLVGEVRDLDNFTLVQAGYFDGLMGLEPGEYYYVSAENAGELVINEPTSGISNPILFADSETSGYVLPYRPSEISQGLLKKYIDNLLVGSVTAFAMKNPPDGWLECDGSAISRLDYKKLFERIGTSIGSGNGETSFNIPNLRGEFIRGWNNGEGVDINRVLGSLQGAMMQSHKHNDTGHGHTDAGHFHPYYHGNFSLPGGAGAEPSRHWSYGNWMNDFIGYANIQNGYSNLTNPTNSGTGAGTPIHGTETRPRNVALMYCIKY